MVVSILVVDVCDEVGLIYLRIDIVVLMRLKIVVFVCSWWSCGGECFIICGFMNVDYFFLIENYFFLVFFNSVELLFFIVCVMSI